jgi:hypothetical protein
MFGDNTNPLLILFISIDIAWLRQFVSVVPKWEHGTKCAHCSQMGTAGLAANGVISTPKVGLTLHRSLLSYCQVFH